MSDSILSESNNGGLASLNPDEKTAGSDPETRRIRLDPSELNLTIEQVSRYAGGSGYALKPQLEPLAERMRQEAMRLCEPLFVYALYRVSREPGNDQLQLDNGKTLPLLDPSRKAPTAIFTAVCTLGPKLEEEVAHHSRQGRMLESLFLDAAGVALMEEVAVSVHRYADREARTHGLFAGCRRSPGSRTLALSMQKTLFAMVNADLIGVHLEESWVMCPVKSLSFWIPWNEEPGRQTDYEKCKNCHMIDCQFRAA